MDTSSVARLYTLLDRAIKAPGQQRPLYEFWAGVLGIVREGEELTARTAADALRAFAWLTEEFERAARTHFPQFEPSDYESAFQSARNAVAWQHVGHPFSSVGPGNLTTEVLRAILMCSRVAIKTERLLTEDELAEITAAVSLLEGAIAALPSGDVLLDVLETQVSEIRQALIRYRISGASALRVALYGLEGAAVNYANERGVPSDVAHANAIAEVSNVSRVVRTAITTSTLIATLAAGMEGAIKIAERTGESQFFFQHPHAQLPP